MSIQRYSSLIIKHSNLIFLHNYSEAIGRTVLINTIFTRTINVLGQSYETVTIDAIYNRTARKLCGHFLIHHFRNSIIHSKQSNLSMPRNPGTVSARLHTDHSSLNISVHSTYNSICHTSFRSN